MILGIWASFMQWLGFKNYQMAGGIDRASEKLAQDPNVVGHAYEEAIRKMADSITHHMEQVGNLVALLNQKENEKKRITDEVGKLEAIMNGALAMARKRATDLQKAGKTPEEIKLDPEFLRHQSAYTDMKSTLGVKNERITALMSDLEQGQKNVEGHQRRLMERKRELDKLKQEKPEMVARVISAKAQAELDTALAGISTDNISEGLQSVRKAVAAVEGQAKVASVLAGTNTRAAEEEYVQFARDSAAQDEFASLVGLAVRTEAAAKGQTVEKPQSSGLLD